MTTAYKGVECLTGDLSMTGYQGANQQRCLQLTFKKPSDLYSENHCNASNAVGYWFLNLSRDQAKELTLALYQWIEGQREEDDD